MATRNRDGIELGRITSEDLFSRDGSLLVKGGTIISYELLSKLKKHKVNYVDMLTEISVAHKAPDIISKEDMSDSIGTVKTVFDSVVSPDTVSSESAIPADNVELVKKVVSSLIALLDSSEELLYRITEVISADEYTYRHSVNVTILTILTSKAMGYTESEIEEIALGALLHDIGKALVPSELLKKKGRLTDEEQLIMKDHPELGYQLVKEMDTIPESVKQIIRMHHEKMDGSGYPNGKKGLDIPKHVRLITVCDMYDAMTTTRSYRKKMPLHTALEILMKDAVYKIDPEIYRKMTSTICLFPTGLGVILSDGRIGIVSKYRHSNPTRPVIQIVDFSVFDGQVNIESIDLEQTKTLFIVDTWNVNDFSKDFRNVLEDHPFYQLDEMERMKYTSSIS